MDFRPSDNDPPEVIIRCGQTPGVFVRLHERYFPDQYGVAFSIEAQAHGLHACLDGVETWIWDENDLADFLTELATDFRGWTGERTWQTNHLSVTASWHSGGHVSLTWTLQPWVSRTDHWVASITTWLEAGEQMTNLASEMHHFLPHPQPRPQPPGAGNL